jgi:hypothetical protein
VSRLNFLFKSAIIRVLYNREEHTTKSNVSITIILDLLDEFKVEGLEIDSIRKEYKCLVTTLARISVVEAQEVDYS